MAGKKKSDGVSSGAVTARKKSQPRAKKLDAANDTVVETSPVKSMSLLGLLESFSLGILNAIKQFFLKIWNSIK